jgi:hypothetical protein
MIRPASRSEVKPLIGLYSESGNGKTYGALLLAKGYVGDMSKVLMIETESGRGEVFAEDEDVGGYQVSPIRDDFSPEAYGAAILEANKDPRGFKALIIDSASHEWEAAGGVLSLAAENEAAGKKGMLVWQGPKMRHLREFMLRVLGTPIPLVILCMRAKYPMRQGIVNGKKDWVRSEILEPKQAEDILFDALIHAWIDKEHNLHITKCSKDELRFVFVDGKPITIETGRRLAEWSRGTKAEPTDADKHFLTEAVKAIAAAKSKDDLEKWAEENAGILSTSPYKAAIREDYGQALHRLVPVAA